MSRQSQRGVRSGFDVTGFCLGRGTRRQRHLDSPRHSQIRFIGIMRRPTNTCKGRVAGAQPLFSDWEAIKNAMTDHLGKIGPVQNSSRKWLIDQIRDLNRGLI